MTIIINGVTLTHGQAMTVHVALQSYAMEIQKENALGDDEHGKFMQQAYLSKIKEINSLLQKKE